ncbi:MAG: hypothetical protein JKX69_03830 [Rhodobacteraceae bacterium]|nr:hypothetical protein [Paracoccaceae bacterium]PHR55899.1 MAG: hypothetical protein COA47_13465 [Robiginitomaculum sp.]
MLDILAATMGKSKMSKRDSADKQKKPKSGAQKSVPQIRDFVVSQAFVVNEHLIDGPDDVELFEDDQN